MVKPNPVVGAVIARDGEVLGEGWHERFGAAHAEVNAIEACGMADLGDATLYVSLEPCCHEGKTPPCTDAIVQAGIRRVVVASDDPTEKASGRGLGILRDEGVEVVLADGELASERAAAEPGVSQARARRAPVGAVQVRDDARRQGRDPDGRLAVDQRRGQPRARPSLARLGGRGGRRHRHGAGRRSAADGASGRSHRRARRISPGASCSTRSRACRPSSQLVSAALEIPLTVVVSRAAARADTDALEAAGVQVLVATGENEPARVRSALEQLGAIGVGSVLLEGGPHLAGAFLDAGEIDEIRLFLAPLLLGGSAARDPLEGKGVEQISEALRALTCECERVGEDLLISARLREW